jgi:hypothetical protein
MQIRTKKLTPFEYELGQYLKELETNEKFSGFNDVTPCKSPLFETRTSCYNKKAGELPKGTDDNPDYSSTDAYALYLDKQKAAAEFNKEIENQYKKSGSKLTFADWYKGFKESETGSELLSGAKALFSAWFDKKTGLDKDDSPSKDEKEPAKFLGMKPMVAALVGLVLVGGLITLFVFAGKSGKAAPVAAK